VRTALRLAAHDLAGSREDVTDTRHAPELRRDVHQATGMISGQLDVTMTEAFARLRAHAVASERTIMAIARDVVGGAITLVHLD
jgi:AmiR/NasT family two-component response regulator